MKSTDSEPQEGGMELEQYRTSLEQMVEEKSKDLIAIQENLEATNRRQALFIKVLQILQLEPDIQSPNQKIPDRKTKCVIKTHINIKQNVIFSAKLKPV